jgi:HAD superfamily hydrolase (TIGR01509 family)
MIKLVAFDLDGVLVDIKDVHYHALNSALAVFDEKYIIGRDEHLSIYDGLKTNEKLKMLTDRKNLPFELHKDVWELKQKITTEMLQDLKKNQRLIDIFSYLKSQGYRIICCSNSIRQTIDIALEKIGILSFFDDIISNENVDSPKPHPQIYWEAMIRMRVLPEETLIVEDSPVGLLAAKKSGANVLRVKNSNDLTIDKIKNKLSRNNGVFKMVWSDEKLNVVIPMAGGGTRFQQAGYTFPKPLIDVKGSPMIQWVVKNLGVDANFIFIVQKSHREKYNLDSMLNLIAPDCKIIEVDGITEGAACTTLLAKELIDNENPLLMANSDQFIEWNPSDFFYKMNEQLCDAGIVTFKSTHPKWSFVKINDQGQVTEVAEKNPISDNATVGIYFWAKGSDYVKYAEQMINKNIRVNNEFYVCPVFNEAIQDSKNIKIFNVEKMWGLGTPEDLNYFLNNWNEIGE